MPHAFRNSPLGYLFGRSWEYSRGNHRKVVTYFGLFLLSNTASLALPLVMALVFNAIQLRGVSRETLPYIWGLLSLLLVREIIFWAFHGPARVMENENAYRVRNAYKRYLLDGVLALPVEWHVNHHTGDTVDKIEKGTSRLFSFTEDTFLIFQMVYGVIGACLALAYFSGTAAFIALGMLALTVLMIAQFDRVLVKQYHQLSRAENRISERLVDIITNITTVVILRIQRPLSQSLARKMEEPFELYQKNIRINEVKWFLVSCNARLIIVLAIGHYLWHQVGTGQAVLLGTVYALYGYAENIAGRLSNVANLYGNFLRQRASVSNAEELAMDFPAGRPAQAGATGMAWREVRIESLTFSYHSEEGGDAHLDDVSLTFRRGEKVALIGNSGSGKSTLLKIIRELYRPHSGRVYLDGQLLPDGFAAISPEIALVPQDPEIFATSILDNITMGVDYPPEMVERYLSMARFAKIAESLPRGLQSSVREKGVNLSGGEKQRLALARGLLASHDKSIVLLDEPTSSIDITNELGIYRNIFEGFPNKTIVSSIHHLHLLPLFDRIHLFRDGRIIASGSFGQLLESSPEFQTLWNRYRETNFALMPVVTQP